MSMLSSFLLILFCSLGIYGQTYHESGIRPTLVAFFNALDGPGWYRNDNWDSTNTSVCTWYGIKCDSEGNITELTLSRNGLNGQMKFSIGLIRSLRILDLSHNAILGKIPPTLSQLNKLTFLDLSENTLAETIPDAFGDFESLEHLDLSGNYFIGEIPSTLGKLPRAKYIDLSDNKLSGRVPGDLGDLQMVEFLNLSRNELDGYIPPQFDMFTHNLHTLDMSHNNFTGFLNGSISQIPKLKHFDISYNQIKAMLNYNFSGLEYCNFRHNEWLCPLDNEEATHYCGAECHRHTGVVPGVAVFSIFCLVGGLISSIVWVSILEKERIKKESGIVDEDDDF
eukprot:TRINITY_DN946_c0_g1_i1.p1 TRINITY_DN946_c0_g1~~TRINITY_DN946_c0_g1_i1.p1  ORF type:complete len:338 (-),score=108.98 TRINITY_DN946_c0_g1_i1:219-1232(-)